MIPFKLIIVKSRNCTFLLKDLLGISIDDFTGSLGKGNTSPLQSDPLLIGSHVSISNLSIYCAGFHDDVIMPVT